ncbi:MAG: hypothetical protein IJT16_11245 [Lachnospiraceae bacterium]|nr:hypothetical protein [Lachnospiraceae bacterium]
MELSEERIRKLSQRIILSRMRLLNDHGFYGLLLMHARISISEEYETAWTDGRERIWFHPKFLEAVTDRELDYALMHQLLHMILGHTSRRKGHIEDLYDEAADIVVNSNILKACNGNTDAITLRSYGGEQPHTLPDKTEGYTLTTEEVYERLLKPVSAEQAGKSGKRHSERAFPGTKEAKQLQGKGSRKGAAGRKGWDAHISSGNGEPSGKDEKYQEEWKQRMAQACEAMHTRQSSKGAGSIPVFAERYLERLKNPQTDWRTILNEFIQEEINDYSFLPPDRRFEDSPFFLPDFNEKDFRVKRILFMVDTSGSMSEKEITVCYSEIRGAIDQFDGKLSGWLGFFDAKVAPPKPFEDLDEFLGIRPVGGGGTSFQIIFDYVREHMAEEPPASIIILTDGYAPFPKQEQAMEIPVLWMINNKDIKPPWGRVARLIVNTRVSFYTG